MKCNHCWKCMMEQCSAEHPASTTSVCLLHLVDQSAAKAVTAMCMQEGEVQEGPGGRSLQVNLANKPALLRAAGLAQTYFTLQPCGLNQPHWHPRGSMTTYVISGAAKLVPITSSRSEHATCISGDCIPAGAT